ncbi:hypothetical protein FA15DRAFT_700429 [Coprinopsis marcescibilis]|uniref:Uncharacterized protein n=1 Tax=Coprinopsis marcescibilis TaxID=230819 RepID=A0A5C3L8R9_COPMA|nr:hypothetical protein FA15DRAFT_700429 [Coprinopsis marcescibilis]
MGLPYVLKPLSSGNVFHFPCTRAMTSFFDFYQNNWSSDPSDLLEQAKFLSQIVYGHLIHLLSTPTSYPTWDDEGCLSAIRRLLLRTATHLPQIPPTAFIRALFLIMRFKSHFPRATAVRRDAELLFVAAFFRVASATCPSFTISDFMQLSDVEYRPWDVNRYHAVLVEGVGDRDRGDSPRDLPRLKAFFHFYVSPFVPVAYHRRVDTRFNFTLQQSVDRCADSTVGESEESVKFGSLLFLETIREDEHRNSDSPASDDYDSDDESGIVYDTSGQSYLLNQVIDFDNASDTSSVKTVRSIQSSGSETSQDSALSDVSYTPFGDPSLSSRQKRMRIRSYVKTVKNAVKRSVRRVSSGSSASSLSSKIH